MHTFSHKSTAHTLLSVTLILLLVACSKSETDSNVVTTPEDTTTIVDALAGVNDQGLKNCITNDAAAFERQFITEIVNLNCVRKGILDLTGIDTFIYITSLDLSNGGLPPYNEFSDISPLSNLGSLEVLKLNSLRKLANIEALSTLDKIRDLSVRNSNLTSIVGLENKPRLEILDLGENRITDLSALAISSGSQTSLRQLILADGCDCNSNSISDLSALENHINLEYLINESSEVTDISALANLTKMTDLSLRYNTIVDVNALSNLVNIVNLNLSYNNIQNVDALSNLSALKIVYLDSNVISGLSNATQTGFLDIEHPVLSELYLSGNRVRDLSKLSNLPSLTTIEVNDNRISILPDDLSLLASLTSFQAGNNNISDISVLATAPNLAKANLQTNAIETGLLSLQSQTNLSNIDLSYNPLLLCSDLIKLDAVLDSNIMNLAPEISGIVVWNDRCDTGGNVDVKLITDMDLQTCFLAAYPTQPVAKTAVQALNCSRLNTTLNVSSMAGLNQLVHLLDLNLAGHNLTDFDNIGNLRKLTSLNLRQDTSTAGVDRNMIQLSRGLQNLKNLDLSNQSIPFANGLAKLYNLNTLNLESTRLRYGIDNLAELETLSSINVTCATYHNTGNFDIVPLFQTVIDTLGAGIVIDNGCG